MEKLRNKIKDRECIIEIFGLGYVGFPLAVRLATNGFRVIGIDVNHERIDRLEKKWIIRFRNFIKRSIYQMQREKSDIVNRKL